jgi:PKD repeat protein
VLVAVEQITDTVPTQAASGNSFSAELNANGDWYVHLSVVDGVGNRSDHHFGPWHMGADFRSVQSGAVNPNQVAAAAPWAQSIIVDGILDRANNEWRPDVEFLDDDERSSRRQSLYASWDQQNFYLGWYGAAWILDGTMFAYFDTASGGARQAIGTGLPALPFDADYAVEVTGLTTGPSASPNAVAVWRYTSGRWQKQSGLPAGFEVVHAGTYFTEMRLPFGSAQVSGDLRVIAFAVDEAGRAWSLFPTTNPLSGPWADAYVWSNPTRSDSDAAPNGGQITSQSAALTLHSPQDALSALGPDDALTYVLEVTNLEAEALPATRLTLAATAGLGYRQLEGDGACVACPTDGAEWVIDLAPIAPQASAHITLTGQLAPALSLTSIEVVTTTARLEWPAPTGTVALAEAALTHVVDNQPPQVEIVTRLGQTLRAGIQDIAGQATDGDGSGVDYVEVRLADAAWQRADGTVVWTKTIDLTGTADGALVRLEARAVDRPGYVSEVAQAEFVVDAQSPVITLDLPNIVAGPFVVLGGAASDPSPTGGRVVKVEVQFDEEGSLWIEASSPVPPGSDWNYTWEPPFNPQNGTPHRVRARAYDEAGNVSDPTAWATTTVFQPWPVDAGFDQTTTEGAPAAFAGSFSEWGSDGPYTLEWDFGDGQTTAGTLTPAHTYFTSDTYTVTLSVAHDGLTVRDSLAMIVLEDQTPPVTTASVTGPTRSGCSSSRYFGQARVTLATNESATTRYRVISFTGSSTPWQTYVGPFNISGEGRNTLQVYSVDLLGNQEAIRHIPVRVTTFPATRVLDSFNRSDGGLGSTWGGSIKLTNYQIISRTVDVNTGGTLYWMEGQPYGADQEAFFKLRVVDMDASEQALLLKVQGGAHPRWQNGAIEVLYDARVGAVRVRTFRPGQLRWKKYADIPIRFYNGDRLGGRVLANGQVWLYRNCLLFARLTLDPADQSFFNARGGRIGVRFTNAADALLDNFGGGTR